MLKPPAAKAFGLFLISLGITSEVSSFLLDLCDTKRSDSSFVVKYTCQSREREYSNLLSTKSDSKLYFNYILCI